MSDPPAQKRAVLKTQLEEIIRLLGRASDRIKEFLNLKA